MPATPHWPLLEAEGDRRRVETGGGVDRGRGRGRCDHLKRTLQMGGVSHIRASGSAMMAAFAGETTAAK